MRVPVSRARLMAELASVNRFGATPAGGAERLSFTDPEVEARTWLVERCRAAGLPVVEQDEAGNVWAWSGADRAVFMGSHLDTVPDGGRFDGALGVVGALEVLRAARDSALPGADRIGLVCWTDEEGSRFGTGMLGSRAVAGVLTASEVEAGVDRSGVRLIDELRRHGLEPARVTAAVARRSRIAAYLELHIEQGRTLDQMGVPVALVTGIVGVSNWRIRVEGEANHAGATRPDDRRDALVPVAAATIACQRAMRAREDLVATVGEAEVVGGASNIVPGVARCTFDIRSPDPAMLDEGVAEIMGALRRAAADNHCRLVEEETKRMPPVAMDARVLEALAQGAADEDVDPPRLPSAAAHDGMNLARVDVPVGMVFVRSEGGISHAPGERSSPADCEAGARVLGAGALRLAAELA